MAVYRCVNDASAAADSGAVRCGSPASRQQTEQQAAWRTERRRWLSEVAASLAPLEDPVDALRAHLTRIAGDAAPTAASAQAVSAPTDRPSGVGARGRAACAAPVVSAPHCPAA